MKRLFILVAIILVTSCYYSNGCIYSPQSVSCFYGEYSDIMLIQKRNRITDNEQRWRDIEYCGGMRTDDGYFKELLKNRVESSPNEYKDKFYNLKKLMSAHISTEDIPFNDWNYNYLMYNCLIYIKGYKIYSKADCYYSKKEQGINICQ